MHPSILHRIIRTLHLLAVLLLLGGAIDLVAGTQSCVNCSTGHSVWCNSGLFGTSCAEFDENGIEVRNLGLNGTPTCDQWGNVKTWEACNQIRID